MFRSIAIAMEFTLFVAKEVDLYKIPPRPNAGGYRSGEWKVADKIFTARCKVVATTGRSSSDLVIKLEDPQK